MKNTFIHNNSYVKKVTPVTSAFDFKLTSTSGFPALPIGSVIIAETLVDQPDGLNNRAFQHHATLGKKNGVLYCAYSIHDYDEDASGLHSYISYSNDNGATWTKIGKACPELSDMDVFGTYPSAWAYPSCFVDINSGFYLLMSAVNGISGAENYQPYGVLVRKINGDSTLGSLEWVNNGISGESRVAPTPLAGYPSYNFANETIIKEVTAYISQPMRKPKILFGWGEVWSTQEDYYLNSSFKLREPTEIRPYNYDKTIKCWKSFQVTTNLLQIEELNETQIISDMPNGNPTARRWLNYSPEIIISLGNSANSSRTEMALWIWRKNNLTGVYELNDGDAYSFSTITKSAPVYAGQHKAGGEQLPYILLAGKDVLDVAFGVSKEEIYFKSINLSKLI